MPWFTIADHARVESSVGCLSLKPVAGRVAEAKQEDEIWTNEALDVRIRGSRGQTAVQQGRPIVTPHKRFDPTTHYAIEETHPDADTSHVKRKHLDIPYAELSPSQELDVYLPDEGDGPFPVIMSIHGGAFMGCDKADLQVLPMLEGLKRGYAVVAVNYRLSWEEIFPALVHDVKAAVRWIRASAQRYHFDPDRIAAWGGSAGGYLSSMLGTSAGIPELEDLRLGNPDQPSNIQAVVDWFGPTDFLKMDEQLTASGMPPTEGTEHSGARSPESLLLGAKITEIPEGVRAANPATHVHENAPPFLIQHGINDPVVPVQQSMELAAKLREVCGDDRVILDLIEGAEHGDPKFETPENVKKVLDFLDQQLK
jgi:acetyl esterase/lipase